MTDHSGLSRSCGLILQATTAYTYFKDVSYKQNIPIYFTAKEEMYAVIREAIEKRRMSPPKDGEYLLIDALLESGLSSKIVEVDALTFLIGGFHTTGLSKFKC